MDVKISDKKHGNTLLMGEWIKIRLPGFGVQGSWFRVRGSGFMVHCSWFRVHGSGFMGHGSLTTDH